MPVHHTSLLRVAVSRTPLPNYFRTEGLRAKDTIQKKFQVMTGRRIAVEIDAPSGFENAAQFHETRSHHRQICKHVVRSQESPERLHYVRHFSATLYELFVHASRILIPFPGILKCLELCSSSRAVFLSKQYVVVLIRFEWGVEVYKINGLAFYVALENVEIIAVEKLIHEQKSIGTRPVTQEPVAEMYPVPKRKL